MLRMEPLPALPEAHQRDQVYPFRAHVAVWTLVIVASPVTVPLGTYAHKTPESLFHSRVRLALTELGVAFDGVIRKKLRLLCVPQMLTRLFATGLSLKIARQLLVTLRHTALFPRFVSMIHFRLWALAAATAA